MSSNANKSLGVIKRNTKTKHTGVPEVAFEYASTVWSPYTQTYSYKLKWYTEGLFAGP